MSRLDPGLEHALTSLARTQHGLIATWQLVELGASRQLGHVRTESGLWRPVQRGVFETGAAPRTFAQRAMAAALSTGVEALVSHRTAARIWEVVPRRAVPIEVSVPRQVQVRRTGVQVHRSRDLHQGEPTTIDGIPVTGLPRTLLDLGAVEPDWVRPAVWEAQRVHDLGWEQLLAALVDHGRPGRRGIGPLRAVVAQHYGDAARESATEDLAYALLVDSGRVPRPSTQVPVTCADGVEVTIDLGWPEWNAYVEVFGGHHLHHEDLLHLDLHRRNQIELAGHALLIYSGRLLRRQPDQFVSDVIAHLTRQGWDGGVGRVDTTA
jgi:hypothetical protein